MKIPFLKMSGAGNDFVVVDLQDTHIAADWPAIIPALCDRRRGIGADGVILLSGAKNADFTMEYFNADGSTGSMCGNGGRCASAYVMDLLGRHEVSFRACGRLYRAAKSGHGVLLQMDEPGAPRMNIPIRLQHVDLVGHFIDTGSPHLVLVGDNIDRDPASILQIGREIRYHAEFTPSGTNVDFVTIMGPDRVGIRTYERGVEDETWACGTGAVAAALIYSILEGKEGSGSVTVTPLSGHALTVGFRRTGTMFKEVTLEGPAVETFTGTYDTDASG